MSIAPSFYEISAWHAARLLGEHPSNIFDDAAQSRARLIGILALRRMFPSEPLSTIAENMRLIRTPSGARHALENVMWRNWFDPDHVAIVYGALLEHEANLGTGEPRSLPEKVPTPVSNIMQAAAIHRAAGRINCTGSLMGDPRHESSRVARGEISGRVA